MLADCDRRICEFLAATLEVWKVDGRVDALESPGVARIRAGEAAVSIVLERAPAGDPFRWYLRRMAADATRVDARHVPRRPCGSLVGVLSGLRRMLEIESAATVRIARSVR